MGTIKTTNIETITGSGTLTLGQSGETISVPSGATLDLSNATQTGVGGVNTPAFLAILSSNQSVSNGTSTKVLLNSTIYDTASAFASNKFTVPSGEDGTYVFYFSVDIYTGSGLHSVTQYVQANIRKNGSAISNPSGLDFRNNYGGYANQITCTIAIPLIATDYIELYMDQAQTTGSPTVLGSSLPYRTYLGGYKLIGV